MHYWHAPPIPGGTPETATVVIRSDCRLTRTMPVWQMREWQARANKPDPANACTACLAATTVTS